MNWEIGIDVCVLPCIRRIASGKLLSSAGSSAWCSVVTKKGGMGSGVGGRSKREEIYVYIWLIHFVVQQKLTQHCKAAKPQLRKRMPCENKFLKCIQVMVEHILMTPFVIHQYRFSILPLVMLNLYINMCLSKAVCPGCVSEGRARQQHHSHLEEGEASWRLRRFAQGSQFPSEPGRLLQPWLRLKKVSFGLCHRMSTWLCQVLWHLP